MTNIWGTVLSLSPSLPPFSLSVALAVLKQDQAGLELKTSASGDMPASASPMLALKAFNTTN